MRCVPVPLKSLSGYSGSMASSNSTNYYYYHYYIIWTTPDTCGFWSSGQNQFGGICLPGWWIDGFHLILLSLFSVNRWKCFKLKLRTVYLDYRFDVKSQEHLHLCPHSGFCRATDTLLWFCRQTCVGPGSQSGGCCARSCWLHDFLERNMNERWVGSDYNDRIVDLTVTAVTAAHWVKTFSHHAAPFIDLITSTYAKFPDTLMWMERLFQNAGWWNSLVQSFSKCLTCRTM